MQSPQTTTEYLDSSRESDFLLRVLADHLAGRKTEPGEGLDWTLLRQISQAHQLSAIVFYQCRSFLPAAEKPAFEKEYAATVFFYTRRVGDVREIFSAFGQAGISVSSVKGLDVARYYPVPNLRSMADCDLVVRPGDEQAAIELLHALGYVRDEHPGHAWTGQKGGRHYELHTVLSEPIEYSDPRKKAFFDDFMPFVSGNHLDWSFHYLFVLSHLRKHFLNHGVGIRQFVDLAVLTAFCRELNWTWIEQKLKELELEDFAHACYSLVEAWFGVTAPVDFARMDSDSVRSVTEKILGNGVFGYADDDNDRNYSRMTFIRSKYPRWLHRLAMLTRSTFPEYSMMKGYRGCGYLDGRPYLLPVAWAQRLGYIVFRKDKSPTGETLRGILTPEREISAHEALLDAMGLHDGGL